jgi:hypothetical protein
VCFAQLTKQHRYKLAPTGKTACVALCSMLAYRPLELITWKKLEHLIEDAAKSIHG